MDVKNNERMERATTVALVSAVVVHLRISSKEWTCKFDGENFRANERWNLFSHQFVEWMKSE